MLLPNREKPAGRCHGRLSAVFVPLMYGLVPVVAGAYFARQLPKFLLHSARVIPALGVMLGEPVRRGGLYNFSFMGNGGIVAAQVVVMVLATAVAFWATARIAGQDLIPLTQHPRLLRKLVLLAPIGCGVASLWLFIIMNATM